MTATDTVATDYLDDRLTSQVASIVADLRYLADAVEGDGKRLDGPSMGAAPLTSSAVAIDTRIRTAISNLPIANLIRMAAEADVIRAARNPE